MEDPKTMKSGRREVSEKVYFTNNRDEKIRPIYQKDIKTGKRSYRLYPYGGNRKDIDLKIHCNKELARYAREGIPIRCMMPDRKAYNITLNSKDIVKLVVES